MKIKLDGQSSNEEPLNTELTEAQWTELENLLENHNKIGAIKQVREWLHTSLYQAKQFVEAHHRKLCELDPARFGKAPASNSGCTVKMGMFFLATALGATWALWG